MDSNCRVVALNGADRYVACCLPYVRVAASAGGLQGENFKDGPHTLLTYLLHGAESFLRN